MGRAARPLPTVAPSAVAAVMAKKPISIGVAVSSQTSFASTTSPTSTARGGRLSVSVPVLLGTEAASTPCGEGGLRQLGILSLPSLDFDPTQHLARLTQLLSPLGQALQGASVRRLGITHGVWILSAGGKDHFVLKRVSAQRRTPKLPTDVEQCEALVRKFPALLSDARLAFPHSVIPLQIGCTHTGDLLVSRWCPGEQLGLYIARLDLSNVAGQQKLERLCKRVGSVLADFHRKYADPDTGEATHHQDFHPGNVLYDESSDAVSIVDLSGMGNLGPKDDVEKFARVMKQWAGERYALTFASSYASSSGEATKGGSLFSGPSWLCTGSDHTQSDSESEPEAEDGCDEEQCSVM
mmetsp:Transcript_100821/g.260558  ORF Transcript_100821/g.260558 Transcript_100821/m.260558 type:complete len:353 (+) Transcript_100821:1-1059(+)